MRKLFSAGMMFLVLSATAQKMQVQNMFNYLRNKDYAKAKEAADLAIQHPKTSEEAKTWMYRGDVYKAIFSDTSKAVRDIDLAAEEKALEAYIRCLELDKGRDVYKPDVKGSLVISAGATLNKANYYKFNKEYEKALQCYDLLQRSIPFDFDGGIKRNNITAEKLMFEKFLLYQQAGDKQKTTEIAGKLIEMNYKEPRIYTDMMKLSLKEKDTAAALQYIEKGKLLFEENMELIGTEIDIYMARKKTDELMKKVSDAIEVSPDNEILHLVLANIYNATGDFANSEKEYLKAIELRPGFEAAIYNLGVLYYNKGKDFNEKQNALPLRDPKFKEYDAKTKENFAKAVEYFEQSYEVTKDPNTKRTIYQLALRLEDREKAAKYK